MTDPTIGGLLKERKAFLKGMDEETPKERFALMESLNQASNCHKMQGWHPILEPHCICGVLDCPRPYLL